MPKVANALKRTYNAVITAEVTARNQLALLSDKARPARKPAAVHVVTFTVYAAERGTDDALEAVHTTEVTVPARADDTELAIVRRAVGRLGAPVAATWWHYEATKARTLTKAAAELAEVLTLVIVRALPPTAPVLVYTGLAEVDDPDNLYEVLHDGDDYAA